jgi:hypothetical protein
MRQEKTLQKQKETLDRKRSKKHNRKTLKNKKNCKMLELKLKQNNKTLMNKLGFEHMNKKTLLFRLEKKS